MAETRNEAVDALVGERFGPPPRRLPKPRAHHDLGEIEAETDEEQRTTTDAARWVAERPESSDG